MRYKSFNLFFCYFATALLVSCSSEQQKKKEHLLPVEVGKVTQKDSPLYIYAVGNTSANFTVDIRSQVTGTLEKAHVEQGQNVSVGQLIYTIDPAPFIAELEQAKAQLRLDEASLALSEDKAERYKSLAEKEYISQLQFDELITDVELAKAKVDVDKAKVNEAAINLDYCYIRSPIVGKMSYNVFDPGNLITANSSEAMTTVRQLDPMLVNFSISQKDFLKLQHEKGEGQTQFEFLMLDTDGKERKKSGVIYFIDNNFDLDTGTILMKGKIENKDDSLWPGEFGKVQLIVKEMKNAILVPEAAVQTGEKGQFVFTLKSDDTVESVNITILEKLGDYMVVSEGLKPGDTVVTSGQINLRPGMKVTVVSNHDEKKVNNISKG
ncbi:MAG: efflux RND transporter periplasmic adaptor subunit [Chlamydiota bacterium]|nr:efflux RND transporter periplasmic adaptor subunit [Chlamydiota bacterium]